MTTFRRTIATLLSTGALAALAAFPGNAETIAGLSGDKALAHIDTTAMKVTKTVDLDTALVAIDVRPADGMLYGVTADGAIVTVDVMTGKTTKKAQISEKVPSGMAISVDFNPVADRMRLIAADGTSLRINVEDGKATVDGKLKYADGDAMKAATPKAGAAAYTNSFAGTKETALYDIDVAAGTLVRQAPPNDGILNTVGKLGVALDGGIAFDIQSDGKGGNMAWLIAGTTLNSVDLATGAAKPVGQIAGLKAGLKDMAILAK
jgi:Domain of unknown function (DUF4394)